MLFSYFSKMMISTVVRQYKETQKNTTNRALKEKFYILYYATIQKQEQNYTVN